MRRFDGSEEEEMNKADVTWRYSRWDEGNARLTWDRKRGTGSFRDRKRQGQEASGTGSVGQEASGAGSVRGRKRQGQEA
ncbi:hypothetical protein NHX12_033315 [Muraenolepis orangiensis]|uniref:Uncharacterized protein n=1 Tax=Muraenolepis orangiensis TaxID=630683 RepID=A0A9Q0IG67_9TELE|nr:hypothetical protein NHX12_033315 [Muraenolepis orangiensis]